MDWNRGPTIGQGASSATVSVATSSATSELFAVKSAELSRSSFLQTEKEILSQLSSPYIVQYRGDQITYENSTHAYNLFMEYVPGGSVSDSIKINRGIDESTIRVFTHQILLGLDYLHDKGIVHCDIKGQNLLIGKDGIKIADFGCAKRATAASAISGTPAYMAPEVARGEEQSFPADVWALGCTVIEMATGSHPFADQESPVSVLYKVGFSGHVPEIPMNISEQAKDFVRKCLKRDPKERPTAKELLQHPFFYEVRSVSSKSNDFIHISPTSVLDQGFWDWDTADVAESSVQVSSGPNSPQERIIGLINLLNLEIPNWDNDEDWISVRIHEDGESSESVEIESIFDSQVFNSLNSDGLDTLAEYYDDVALFLNCFSLVNDTLMLSEHSLDDTISRYSHLEGVSEDSIVVQFKCPNAKSIVINCESILMTIISYLSIQVLLDQGAFLLRLIIVDLSCLVRLA